MKHLRAVLLCMAGAAAVMPAAAYAADHGDVAFATPLRVSLQEPAEGVSAFDLDANGRVDLVMPADEHLRVLFQDASGFGPETHVALPDPFRSVRSVDFDGDGTVELLSLSPDRRMLGVLRWVSGAIVEVARYELGMEAGALITSDLDADGDADLIIVRREGGEFTVILNHGTTLSPGGVFAVPPAEGICNQGGIAVGDMNGDGLIDVVVGHPREMKISVFPGLGGGDFGAPIVSESSGRCPIDIRLGDFDGDADLDVALSTGVLGVLTNDGDGRLGDFRALDLPYRFFDAFMTSDIDGDGFTDIVGIDNSRGYANRGSEVVVIPGPVGAHVHERAHVVEPRVESGTIADVNGDDLNDIVFASSNSFPSRNSVSMLLNRGGRLLGAPMQYRVPGAAHLGDINEGHVTDLDVLNVDGRTALVCERGDAAFLIRNDGRGWFTAPEPMADGFPVAIEDLNGDEHDDLIVPGGPAEWAVKLGDGAANFTMASIVPAGGVLADIDGDDRRDLVYGLQSGALTYRPNLGGGRFGAPVALGSVTATPLVTAHLFANLDGRPGDELVIALAGPDRNNTLEVWTNWKGREFRNPVRVVGPSVDPRLMAYEPIRRVMAADLNCDDRPDLIVAGGPHDADGFVATVIAMPDGSWRFHSVVRGANEPGGMVVVDFDRDGVPDVAEAEINSNGEGRARIYRSLGDGRIEHAETHVIGDYPVGIVSADFDGDGLVDLAVPCVRFGTISLLWNASTTPAPRAVAAHVVATDLSGGRVRIEWSPETALHARVERAERGMHWMDFGPVISLPSGRLAVEDENVEPGRRYGYRLVSMNPQIVIDGSEAWVKLMPRGGIRVHGVAGVAAGEGGVVLSVEADAPGEGDFEIFDISGRRVASARGVRLAAGSQRVAVPGVQALGPSVYWARVRNGEQVGVGRVVVVR